MGIGGAFFNADITNTIIKVYIRLNRILTAMMVLIDPADTRRLSRSMSSLLSS